MKETIVLTTDEFRLINQLLSMTGDEIYEKFGYKRDESITRTATFPDGVQVDIKLVICDGDAKPYTEGVLFNSRGIEECFTECMDSFVDSWEFEMDDVRYEVEVLCLNKKEKT